MDAQPPAGRRAAVLHLLRHAAEPLTIQELADQLAVHPNTVRFHLDALTHRGQVERVEVDRRTTGRPPQRFRPVRGMDPGGPRHYQVLAELLVQSLADDPDRDTRAVEAGRAWGRRRIQTVHGGGLDSPSRAVAALVDLLDELSFAPEAPGGTTVDRIELRHCPFLELATSGPQIVCAVHLGLMQGALEGTPLTVDRLEPFAEPDVCLAHLASARTC